MSEELRRATSFDDRRRTMKIRELPPAEEPMTEAFERVYDSGQRLLDKRLDLLVAESWLIAEGVLLIGIAVLLIVGAILWFSYAAYCLLNEYLSPASAAALVGVSELALGAALGFVARRRFAPMDGS